MHELPVTENIYKIVMKSAAENHAKKVNSIIIKMGEGCDFVPEIIEEYLQVFTEGTIAHGAKIIPEVIPTQILCKNCNTLHPKDLNMYVCPKCGSDRLRPMISSELSIEKIEMEF